eukprot:6063367-Pleurochrysis_carterae.AAC.1
MHCRVIYHAQRSAEAPGIACSTGQAILKCVYVCPSTSCNHQPTVRTCVACLAAACTSMYVLRFVCVLLRMCMDRISLSVSAGLCDGTSMYG